MLQLAITRGLIFFDDYFIHFFLFIIKKNVYSM